MPGSRACVISRFVGPVGRPDRTFGPDPGRVVGAGLVAATVGVAGVDRRQRCVDEGLRGHRVQRVLTAVPDVARSRLSATRPPIAQSAAYWADAVCRSCRACSVTGRPSSATTRVATSPHASRQDGRPCVVGLAARAVVPAPKGVERSAIAIASNELVKRLTYHGLSRFLTPGPARSGLATMDQAGANDRTGEGMGKRQARRDNTASPTAASVVASSSRSAGGNRLVRRIKCWRAF
jgi:hypothetical protein